MQLKRFTALASGLRAHYPSLLCHTANSAATLRDPAAHFDMVRPGIALYGLHPCGGDPAEHDLQPVMRFTSYLAAVRELQAGESVGYGQRFVATQPERVGVVPVGYADGVRRALGGVGEVLVAGRRCRIVGAVSMDQLTVLLPPGHGAPGDPVVLFGTRDLLCEEVAHLLGTITHEVVCDVGARVRRVPAEGGARSAP